MRITPPPMEIGEEEGFTPSKDLFGLKQLGDGMTNLVTRIEEPLVMALDGQWGSGKTTFLKMWAGELRRIGIPTIYFDAFENDYVEDAFAALVREVALLIESKENTSQKARTKLREAAPKLFRLIGVAGARTAINIGVRAATAGLVDASTAGAALDEALKVTSDIGEKYLEELLAEPRQQKQTVESFRKVLAELPALLAPPKDDGKQVPIVFIIDELDRCKPDYALQMLERIKHFLTVPSLHFVLGVHLAQLQNSVRVAYGNEVEAVTYLQKFINLTISHVKSASHPDQAKLVRYVNYLSKSLNLTSSHSSLAEKIGEFICHAGAAQNISLRAAERIYSHITICLASTNDNQFRVAPLIAGLCMLRVVAPELYEKARRGTLSYDEIAPVFGFPSPFPSDLDHDQVWAARWWQNCLLETPPKDSGSLSETGYRYNLPSDRRQWIPIIVNTVVERFLFAES